MATTYSPRRSSAKMSSLPRSKKQEYQSIRYTFIVATLLFLLLLAGSVHRAHKGFPSRPALRLATVTIRLEVLLDQSAGIYDDATIARLKASLQSTEEQEQRPTDQALQWLALNDEADKLSLQRYALVVFYFYTSSSGEGWNECSPSSGKCSEEHGVLDKRVSECLWYGITCDDEQQQVIRIEWTDNNLTSSQNAWPDALILLSPHLELLWLSDNPLLSIQMPSNLGLYRNLQSLALQKMALQGSIPDSLYTLKHLYALRLYETQLTGTLSEEIGNLSEKLSWLWLHATQLDGTLPQSISQLTVLEGLTLHDTSFEIQNDAFICSLKENHELDTYWTNCESNTRRTCSCCTKCFVPNSSA